MILGNKVEGDWAHSRSVIDEIRVTDRGNILIPFGRVEIHDDAIDGEFHREGYVVLSRKETKKLRKALKAGMEQKIQTNQT